MTLKSPARSALRIPYLAVRTPLGLLDELLVVRVFGAESTAHRTFVRGLDTLDCLAASAFAAADTVDADPTDDAEVAVDDEVSVESSSDVQPVERGGEQPIDTAEQHEIDRLTETFLAEDELTPRSGELAENGDLRRVQAEIRAKQAIETEHGQI